MRSKTGVAGDLQLGALVWMGFGHADAGDEMESTQQFFEEGEAEATLVTPRFDVQELQTARPVVPLTQRQSARGASGRPRSLGLLLMSALLGGAVSVFAFRLYQQRQHADTAAAPAAITAPAQTQPVETATNDVSSAVAAQPGKDELERGNVADARRTAKAETVKSNERPAVAAAPTERERPKARLIEVIPAAPRQAEADDQRNDDGGLSPEERREERRARRRERREQRTQPRNVDRIRDIFEGAPPF